jgi:hypothetical protein
MLRQLPRLLGAEALDITGLYIEDEDLMRAARLPGLREISLSGQVAELNLERLQRDIAADLALVRESFEALARELSLRCRLEVARGRLAEALSAAAAESDFVVVSRTLRSSGLRARAGVQFRPLLHETRSILFVNEPWASGTSVIVLGDDPEAIATGERVAKAAGLRLVAALPRGAPVPDHLPDACDIVRLSEWSEDMIAELCLRRDARLLIVTRDATLDTATLLASLLDRLPCSLLKLA